MSPALVKTNKQAEDKPKTVPNLEDKIDLFANLILDRIAEDVKNNCLKYTSKS